MREGGITEKDHYRSVEREQQEQVIFTCSHVQVMCMVGVVSREKLLFSLLPA